MKESLGEFDISFQKIYASRWSNKANNQNPNKYWFVVETNSPVVWYRYKSGTDSSTQNYMFLDKKELKQLPD